MSAFAAIVKQTIKASLRSRVFHVLTVVLLLAVIGLPLTVEGPGTAVGQLQVSVRYSLGVVSLLVLLSSLWVGCSNLPKEIDTYRLHLVRTKPAPPWVIWLGKWFAVFLMHTAMFLFAAVIVYGLIQWRMTQGDFSEEELVELKEQVLIGRQNYRPERPDFQKQAIQEYKKRQQEGKLPSEHNPKAVLNDILEEVKRQEAEIPAGQEREWTFTDMRVPDDVDAVYCRYRLYRGGEDELEQEGMTRGVWRIENPNPEGEGPSSIPLPKETKAGTFHEMRLPAQLVSDDGELTLSYRNLDPARETVILELEDGPEILVSVRDFWANYGLATVLVVMQIAFLAALGCAVGSAFSTPVAIFVGIAYLMVGFAVAPLSDDDSRPATVEEADAASETTRTYGDSFSKALKHAVVSLDDYQTTGMLIEGEAVPLSLVGSGFLYLIIFRGGALGLIGIVVLTKRELGKVVRQ